MADIRIKDLPLATGGTAPVGADVVAIDGLTTRRTTITALGNVAVPIASQATAEAGVNATERMVPVTVKQSIASEIGGTIASAAQGALADSALQPGDAAPPAQGALADTALQPDDIGVSIATIAQGNKADAALPLSSLPTSTFAIKSPSSYLTTNRSIRERFLDGGVSILEGGGSGGVNPGQGDANADTAAILNLISDMPAIGGSIRAVASRDTNGLYLINDRVLITGKKRVAILGESIARTVFRRVSGGTAGLFRVDMDTPGQSPREIVEISGMTIEAATAIVAPAIDLTWATAASTGAQGFVLRDIMITSDEKSNQTKYFETGIRVLHARESFMQNIILQGPDLNSTAVKSAVSIEGGSVSINMIGLKITHAQTGVFAGVPSGSIIPGECEGIHVFDSEFVTVNEGVVASQNPNELGGHTLVDLQVMNCHSNAMTGFVRAYGVSDVQIKNNAIQKRDESTLTYRDVDLVGYCSQVQITGNKTRLRGTSGTEAFVHLRNATGIDTVYIGGNEVLNRDYVLECAGTGATNVELAPNTVGSDVTNLTSTTLPSSSTTRFSPQSKPRGTADTNAVVERPFVASDTSPSVVSSLTNWFRTSNASATTITQFDDGYEGQVIQIRANDANTTIAHNSNIILKTGANTLMPNGGIMVLFRFDAFWIERSRSF